MHRQPTVGERIDAIQAQQNRFDLQGALAQLDQALLQEPHHPRLVSQKITILRQMGRDEDALAFARALPQALRQGRILHHIVSLLTDSGCEAEAVALLERAGDRVRSSPACIVAALRLTQRRSGPEAALAQCRLLGGDPVPLPLLREEAQLLITLGRTDEARDLLAGALDKKPNASLLQILLRLHLNSGDVAGMRQQLEHHGDLIAELPWSAFFPARACEVEQDLTGALAFSTAGVARFPDHLHLQMLHWRLLSLNGRRSDATAAATAFAEAHEDNLRAQVEAAQVLNRLGAAEAADAALERCIALAPRNTGVLIARARIMISRKDALGARSLLEALPPSVRDRDSIQHKIAQDIRKAQAEGRG